MTLKSLQAKAEKLNAVINKRDDGNYRIIYGYKNGVTYVSNLKCYICNKDCLQAWTSWKKGRKATCSRKCMDRGMYHDKQHLHDGKWWDKYSNHKGYKAIKRKDPNTSKIMRSYEHADNFEKEYSRKVKPGHQLHHNNMCKTDNRVSNLTECSPRKHQLLHATYNNICKDLMDMGIVGFDKDSGYYLIKQ